MKKLLSIYRYRLLVLLFVSISIVGYVFTLSASHALGMTYDELSAYVYSLNYCQKINSTEDVLRSGYGSPFNFFTNPATLAIQTLCSENGVQLTVGTGGENEYILDYALQRVDGVWKKVELTGGTKVGSWYIGSAQALIASDSFVEGKTERIIAYTCQKVNGSWKCGCRDEVCATPYWQIQEFEYSEEYNETANLEIDEDDEMSETYTFLYPPTPHTGPVGTKVVITGVGLSKTSNTVFFDGEVVAEKLPSVDGDSITFTIPATITPGYKRIKVVTDLDSTILGTSFIVTVPGTPKPVITSITPNKGTPGTEVTVFGSNFSKESNDILIGFDVIKGVVSKDGTSLTFKLDPLKELSGLEGFSAMEGEMPIYVVVVNAGGPTESTIFTMNF